MYTIFEVRHKYDPHYCQKNTLSTVLVRTLAGGASPPLPTVVYVFKPLCVAKAAKEAGAGRMADGNDVFVCDGILAGFPNPGGRIVIMAGFGRRGSPCGPPCNC